MLTDDVPNRTSNHRVWEFDRYVSGRLKAEGVRISKAETFEEACLSAVSLASPGSVLVLRPDMKLDHDSHATAEQVRACPICTPSTDETTPKYNEAERAEAWVEVCKTLTFHNKEWFLESGTGVDCAIREIRRLQALDSAQKAPAEPPYRVRAFWSPDRVHLVTACCSADDITLLDDNANIWEPTGPEQDMTKPEALTENGPASHD